MLEESGDLWTLPADARCITTNGTIRGDGKAVMGRGCAQEARNRYPGLDTYLGLQLHAGGNHVHHLMQDAKEPRPTGIWVLLSFPVKHHWREKADLELIRRSCGELMLLMEVEDWQRVLLPRPGCGNGQLGWDEVGPAIAPLLDDRVVVIDR